LLILVDVRRVYCPCKSYYFLSSSAVRVLRIHIGCGASRWLCTLIRRNEKKTSQSEMRVYFECALYPAPYLVRNHVKENKPIFQVPSGVGVSPSPYNRR
jgi:hypothetical protein